MVLSYTGTLTSDMLVAEIQEHVDWFTQVIRAAFFFPGKFIEIELNPPSALLTYLRDEKIDNSVLQRASVDRLEELHKDLCDTAKEVVVQARGGQQINVEQFEKLEQFMDAYCLHLRRIENEILSSGLSIDPVTGLRSVSGMKDELKREMDRRDRKNVPFCVCNLSMDETAVQPAQYDRRSMEKYFAAMAAAMSDMMRSFDDAYHLGQGEFIICLKHVDLLDACTVMERLLKRIEDISITSENGQQIQGTASCGVVEPMPDDEIDYILQNAKQTRKEAQEDGGNLVFQYTEKSRLSQIARQTPTEF